MADYFDYDFLVKNLTERGLRCGDSKEFMTRRLMRDEREKQQPSIQNVPSRAYLTPDSSQDSKTHQQENDVPEAMYDHKNSLTRCHTHSTESSARDAESGTDLERLRWLSDRGLVAADDRARFTQWIRDFVDYMNMYDESTNRDERWKIKLFVQLVDRDVAWPLAKVAAPELFDSIGTVVMAGSRPLYYVLNALRTRMIEDLLDEDDSWEHQTRDEDKLRFSVLLKSVVRIGGEKTWYEGGSVLFPQGWLKE